MENQNQLIPAPQDKQPKNLRRQARQIGAAVAATTTYALATVPAHAESSLTSVGAAFTGELDGAKAVIITILSAAAIVLGLLVGWRYMKRGGNSA